MQSARRLLQRIGFDISRFDSHHPLARRMRYVQDLGIDLVLDVGANTGQFAREMRQAGYKGRIVSFEPLSSAFTALAAAARHDTMWNCHRFALGAEDGTATLSVAGNSQSSSLLPMREAHVEAAPGSGYVAQECITVRRLDNLWPELAGKGGCPYLKIDVQGFERQVLEGATAALAHISLVQIEVSLVSLYEGDMLIDDLLTVLRARGFDLWSIEPGYADPRTWRQLQVDCVFAQIIA